MAVANEPNYPNTPPTLVIPVLPLRDVVVYPYMVVPLFVGRERSIKALEAGMAGDKQVLLVAQRNALEDQPTTESLYSVGTLSTILQFLKLPDGTVKVLVEGVTRATILRFAGDKDCILAEVHSLQENKQEDSGTQTDDSLNETVSNVREKKSTKHSATEGSVAVKRRRLFQKKLITNSSDKAIQLQRDIEILTRLLKAQFERYVKLHRKIPSEIMASILSIEEADRLGDTIAAHLNAKLADKQELLETFDLINRLEKLVRLLEGEIDFLQAGKELYKRVKERMEKKNRAYYLVEQKAAIQQELNEIENIPNEFEVLDKKIKETKMPKEVREKCRLELTKLEAMPIQSAEATVSRNYLDVILSLPWNAYSKKSISLQKAKEILDAEHYGLKEVKECILEHLAVQKRTKLLKKRQMRQKRVNNSAEKFVEKETSSTLCLSDAPAGGKIICLVGAPGVGKTSVGKSIAHATGREYIRIPLGGVRDEAEIRGHRRTYVGAMPGRIIQRLIKSKKNNPVILLDEIDKMATDFRGDPAAALLEVLDPEQNNAFNDHYLEIDYDLSHVLFVATANSSAHIPFPLLDRLEIIRIPGYTEDEKIHIATGHLMPKQRHLSGLTELEIHLSQETIKTIIQYYTREAGVRNLDRTLSKICRKVVKKVLLKEIKGNKQTCILPTVLEDYLGPKQYRYDIANNQDQIGQVNGLAWTEVGGELLSIEAVVMPGTGKTIYTGQLGKVMQESIQAALTVVRTRSLFLGIEKNFFSKHDIHIHVPEGATPKDGPSAGISMCTALVSILTHLPVRHNFAMTGEITLRGEILQIGGLKEKLLAAHRSGIKQVIIPTENVKDLPEIPDIVKQDIHIQPMRWIDDVLYAVLNGYPEYLSSHKKKQSPLLLMDKKALHKKHSETGSIETH